MRVDKALEDAYDALNALDEDLQDSKHLWPQLNKIEKFLKMAEDLWLAPLRRE